MTHHPPPIAHLDFPLRLLEIPAASLLALSQIVCKSQYIYFNTSDVVFAQFLISFGLEETLEMKRMLGLGRLWLLLWLDKLLLLLVLLNPFDGN